jgi:hypothetical protein
LRFLQALARAGWLPGSIDCDLLLKEISQEANLSSEEV